MLKICDFSFYVDIEPIYWPANMHESLLIDIYLLLFHFSPWTLIRSVSVLEVDRKLHYIFLKEKTRPQVIVLHHFFAFSRWLSGMSDGFVCQLLSQGSIQYIPSK